MPFVLDVMLPLHQTKLITKATIYAARRKTNTFAPNVVKDVDTSAVFILDTPVLMKHNTGTCTTLVSHLASTRLTLAAANMSSGKVVKARFVVSVVRQEAEVTFISCRAQHHQGSCVLLNRVIFNRDADIKLEITSFEMSMGIVCSFWQH